MNGRALPRRHIALGSFCLCCLPWSARQASAGALFPAYVTEVASGIYIRQGVTEDATPGNSDSIANIGFIVGRDAVAVIDPGGSLEDGQSLFLAIRQVTRLPIRYVVMTHVHPDHVFGAAAFQAEKPTFIGHANLPQALGIRGEYYRDSLERILGSGRAGPIVMPSVLVRDQAEIDLGGRTLVLTAHSTAHTNCDLSVVDRMTGVLLAGDLLFVNRVPSLDGDLRGWLAQLAILNALNVRSAVPGHGPALVDWADAAGSLNRYLTALLNAKQSNTASRSRTRRRLLACLNAAGGNCSMITTAVTSSNLTGLSSGSDTLGGNGKY